MLTEIEDSLKKHIVRLQPSKIKNAGIGLFAVTYIPKDTLLFPSSNNYLIPWNLVPESIRDYLNSICHTTNEGVYLDRPPNEIYTAYYINHSETPNVFHDSKNDNYWTIRDIEPGQEITCYYPIEERDWLCI